MIPVIPFTSLTREVNDDDSFIMAVLSLACCFESSLSAQEQKQVTEQLEGLKAGGLDEQIAETERQLLLGP